MHIVALAILALLAGLIYNFAQPKLSAMLPASTQNGTVVPALVSGAFILLTIVAASFVMGFFPRKFRATVPKV